MKQFHEERLGYYIIPIFVISLYISIIASYLDYTNHVLPRGDPFTYTLGYFRIIDVAQHNIFNGLIFAFQSNYYWLINLVITLFSPILAKEPLSIAVVNFFMWGIASISFYRLGLYLKLNFGLSMLLALIIWVYPINYGFLDHTSIPVLALDAMFLGILHVALANVMVYSLDTQKLINALIAGFSVGLAIWGRGNSTPVVFLVIFIPLLMILYNVFINRKDSKILINFALFSLLILFMGCIYYYIQYAPIALYYKSHTAFVIRHQWNLKDALPFILNVPGFFFWRVDNSIPTISITIIFHVLVILSILINRKSILSITGAFIYFATYIIDIMLFTDPLITLQNCLLIYAPMRIGLSLCLISIIERMVQTKKIKIPKLTIYVLIVFLILYGSILMRKLTPKSHPGAPTSSEVESFSIKLGELTNGGTISVLWYGNYNSVIVNYYRRMNDLPEIPIYSSTYYNDIWVSYDYSSSKRIKVRKEIRKHFEEASLIILPENMKLFSDQSPYSVYRFKDEIFNYLNSPESPKFVVRMVVKEGDGKRLLVLQRDNESNGKGESLRLPFGNTAEFETNYGPKVIRHPS